LQFDHYMIAAALGLLVIGGAALPLVVALAVAWWPGRRPAYKFPFVITATVVVLGVAGLLSLLSLPFELFGTYLSPQLDYEGHKTVPMVVGWVFAVTDWLPSLAVAVGSVLVPVVLRRQLWERLCEVMASRPLQPIAREDARSG
jgi:hypothetical protein